MNFLIEKFLKSHLEWFPKFFKYHLAINYGEGVPALTQIYKLFFGLKKHAAESYEIAVFSELVHRKHSKEVFKAWGYLRGRALSIIGVKKQSKAKALKNFYLDEHDLEVFLKGFRDTNSVQEVYNWIKSQHDELRTTRKEAFRGDGDAFELLDLNEHMFKLGSICVSVLLWKAIKMFISWLGISRAEEGGSGKKEIWGFFRKKGEEAEQVGKNEEGQGDEVNESQKKLRKMRQQSVYTFSRASSVERGLGEVDAVIGVGDLVVQDGDKRLATIRSSDVKNLKIFLSKIFL